MSKKVIRFGVIGCGLMGKEFTSVTARWCHLTQVNFEPRIVAVCDANPNATKWFLENINSVERTYINYKDLLEDSTVDAIYCAVPHHLHAQIYIDIIHSGKHLLGEKPFGIDLDANYEIQTAMEANPNVLVRCSSEFPFFPGAQQIVQWVNEGRFGKIIDVEAGFWHSSDLDPNKPINWKRQIQSNGEYGCMGDLGLHVLHLPLRFGWKPNSVRSLLSKVVDERPDGKGGMLPCETWDNAILACDVNANGSSFPMILSTKRIAPGHMNTWFLQINGTEFSAKFSTKNPKQISSLPYTSGQQQAWHVVDVPYKSAYETITGTIFEFGFSDSILQMWAAFCDEVVNGKAMMQTFQCALPEEATDSHRLFTAALDSHRSGQTISINWQ
ncbi:Gfo/Idh/MocA family protein [Paenibacillus endoradicis]|uniref:Gfo/Idh/MocA family protein n=1 Tax=Paenibacillus endoradicis TaxID=2972487 RepID=UPI002159857E|nr:Gfo/Idh/MocA family oxidoreductase [Paenibacillus endoradicis]MCR8660599.1 Gfo/Idh/MocA family oxidoreductase [Paenibacillus endoradicis]